MPLQALWYAGATHYLEQESAKDVQTGSPHADHSSQTEGDRRACVLPPLYQAGQKRPSSADSDAKSCLQESPAESPVAVGGVVVAGAAAVATDVLGYPSAVHAEEMRDVGSGPQAEA